jgi:hypothetical protein
VERETLEGSQIRALDLQCNSRPGAATPQIGTLVCTGVERETSEGSLMLRALDLQCNSRPGAATPAARGSPPTAFHRGQHKENLLHTASLCHHSTQYRVSLKPSSRDRASAITSLRRVPPVRRSHAAVPPLCEVVQEGRSGEPGIKGATVIVDRDDVLHRPPAQRAARLHNRGLVASKSDVLEMACGVKHVLTRAVAHQRRACQGLLAVDTQTLLVLGTGTCGNGTVHYACLRILQRWRRVLAQQLLILSTSSAKRGREKLES